MPGKFRKSPPSGGNRPAIIPPLGRSPAAPTPKPVLPPSVPLPRPAVPGGGFRRGADQGRINNRIERREAVQQAIRPQNNLPRPTVRPAAPPRKVMAKTPTPPPPPAAGLAKSRPRPGTPPAAAQARPQPRPGIAGGGVIGAAALANLALNLASAHPSLQPDAAALQSSLERLQNGADFQAVEADLSQLDSSLNHALNLLESARSKGFAYQKDLDGIAHQAASRWQAASKQVQLSLQQERSAFQAKLAPIGQYIRTVNSVLGSPDRAAPHLRIAGNQVNTALGELNRIQTSLESVYADVERDVMALNGRLTRIHWALDQLAQAKFTLERAENLVMAVPARWDQAGEDDPEGILYLTNQRLIFERKEKVATKKLLFITMAAELVQEVLIDQKVKGIKEVKAASRGLFGHQDFLEVVFVEPKLGSVPLHLNGQESEMWAALIRSVQTGEIEKDRATAAGISVADLTRPLTSADLVELQREVNELGDEMLLSEVRQALEELEGEVNTLRSKLASVRARGYQIEKSLEGDLEILLLQWERIKHNTLEVLEKQTQALGEQYRTVQAELGRVMGASANLAAARPLYIQTKSAIASAEATADAAEDTVLAQFDAYDDQIDAFSAHLDWVVWMLDALASASFRLLATESGVAATEAIWARPGLEPENGILFLTDQRLLWEDRVETFELKLDQPLASVLDCKLETVPESGDQALVFELDAGAPLVHARLELALPVGDEWQRMVGRARRGEYLDDRATPITQEELERIRNAPTRCSNCGAALTAPILRGQTEIVCEYCAVVTRL